MSECVVGGLSTEDRLALNRPCLEWVWLDQGIRWLANIMLLYTNGTHILAQNSLFGQSHRLEKSKSSIQYTLSLSFEKSVYRSKRPTRSARRPSVVEVIR